LLIVAFKLLTVSSKITKVAPKNLI